ncbi:hypothetical protein ACFXTH_009941 [Malus domestica]
MFPFSQGLFSSAGEMKIEGVVIEEVLVEFLNVLFRRDLTLTAQRLKSPSIKKRLQVKIRWVPGEGRIDGESSCRGAQDGGDIKNGGADETNGENHGVGGRTPEAQGG